MTEATLENFMENVQEKSENRIQKVHHLAKRIWKDKKFSPITLRNKCLDAWDRMKSEIDCEIIPLIPIKEDRNPSNLIFGSGSFSTGQFQVEQYEFVKTYASNPPMELRGLVSNKSSEHGCKAQAVANLHKIPLIELDFTDWYHDFIEKNETNPTGSTRYWYAKDDSNRPTLTEISRRFKIRQDQFHKALGDAIYQQTSKPIDLVSARGYNFQFCRNLFHHQNHAPHINDTHPADLTYINPTTKERLYPGWQSGAVQLMLNDHHTRFRGSLIEVDYMDTLQQINDLDEGALIAMSEGVDLQKNLPMQAQDIQAAMKIMDDYFYCTLEPTGLYQLWGITTKKIPVVYQTIDGKQVVIKQYGIVVGNQFKSGLNAWGLNLKEDLKDLSNFLLE